MIRYKIYQNQQQKGLNAGKWFARAVSDETFDLAKLAEHMSKHNSPYSAGDSFPFRRYKDTTLKPAEINSLQLHAIVVNYAQ